MRTPEMFDVPVRGGVLRVARWRGRPGAPVVIGAHGITANHRNFSLLAEHLGDDVTLLAPDLRGRGGSNGLPPPYGMRAHVEDMIAVLDREGAESALFVGHSMGGFVVPVAPIFHPDRVGGLLVVDGGIKLAHLPEGVDIEEIARAVIGPSIERLKMTFASVDAYLDFWRPHPALKEAWDDDRLRQHLEAYLSYDLIEEAGSLRSSVRLQAVLDDSTSELTDPEIVDAIERVTHPMTFLHAERGVFDQTPGLYSQEAVAALRARAPQAQTELVAANHFTLLFGSGVTVVADHVRKMVNP